jgi:PST family polysaccharide transporter
MDRQSPDVPAATPQDGAKRRARAGVVALAIRSSAQLVLSFVGTLILARLLKPADFGVFAVIQFTVTLFSLVGNLGLAPALVQQKTAPTQRLLSTVWWAQLGVASLVVPLLWWSSDLLREVWRDLPDVAEPLVRVLALSFLLNSLRVVPTVLLERGMRFSTLAVVELCGSAAYFGTAVGVAYATGSVSALVYAVIVQTTLMCVLCYVVMPWRPRLEFDAHALAGVVRYGAAFQGSTLVGFANSAVAPLLVGVILGKTALGLSGFAQALAWLPLRLVEIFGRVGFPYYSTLQDDRERLGRELRLNVQACGIVTALFSTLLLVVGEPALQLVYGDTWRAAVPLLQIYATAVLVGFLSPLGNAALNAMGRPGVVFRLTVGWTLLNWAVVAAALYWRPSIEVYALASSVHVVVGNLVVAVLLSRLLPSARIARSLFAPIAAAVVVATMGAWLLTPHLHAFLSTAIAGAACVGLVAFVAFNVDRDLVVGARAALRVGRNVMR